jgi:hypothetical protein
MLSELSPQVGGQPGDALLGRGEKDVRLSLVIHSSILNLTYPKDVLVLYGV